MPTYEYVCTSCGHQWETVQRITENALTTCPSCSAETAKRQVSGGHFILKGGGWYADLYSSSSKPKSSGGETKSEAPKADSGSGSSGSGGGSSGSSGGGSSGSGGSSGPGGSGGSTPPST